MEKLDLTKQFKTYYTAKSSPEIVHFDAINYISITGKGDPSGEDFAQKIEALYSTIYSVKFNWKAKEKDFVVAKLEGLWWFDESKYQGKTVVNSPTEVPRSEWEYRLLIRLPEFVTKANIETAKQMVLKKKQLELVNQVDYFTLHEGKCIQMLHVGPFSTEPESLAIIMEFSEKNNLQKNGLHHEIYLSDFRKTAPEKLKTILREPVK
jgi:hypothetical protein